jgi:CheY-like chemotaxis protein
MRPSSQPPLALTGRSRDANKKRPGVAERTPPRRTNSDICRVVVASGDWQEREEWTSLLSRLQLSVLPVNDGDAALQAVRFERIDLVVAAVTLTKVDGLELLSEIGRLAHPPAAILIAKGHGEIDGLYLKIAQLQGAAATYTQPLDEKSFLAGIRAALGLADSG